VTLFILLIDELSLFLLYDDTGGTLVAVFPFIDDILSTMQETHGVVLFHPVMFNIPTPPSVCMVEILFSQAICNRKMEVSCGHGSGVDWIDVTPPNCVEQITELITL